MPAAPLPENELQRLEELLRYEIMDSPTEPDFDDLTHLASVICEAPVSLISLVDDHRQWFKSCRGLGARETPREQAFCGYTILDDVPFIITDAPEDPRVSDNPLVTGEPGIRFYAGVPLISPRGFRLGSLCVIDFEPRGIDDVQIAALEALGRQVVTLLELRYQTARLTELNRVLTEARSAAQDAAEAKSRFVAMMSHEIRTPLNGTIGMLELLEDAARDEKERVLLDTATRSARTLLTIVNEILDLSKVESGKMELAPVPTKLSDPALETARILRIRAEEEGVLLHVEVDDSQEKPVLLDPDRLRQVLLNLVGNAIKFTPRGGEVRVHVDVVDRERDRLDVEFRIVDTGIGISEEQQAHIFAPFSQATATTTRQFGGTGLGLSISSKLVQLMGGKLAVESESGVGSTFRFTIPVPEVEGTTEDTAQRTPQVSSPCEEPKHVLVVDDYPANRLLIETHLKRRGHTYRVATNGQEAVDLCQEASFDVILMDVEMPVMDGIDAAREIQRQWNERGLEPVPIVALTAHALQETAEACQDAGMCACVTKPVDRDELFRAIESTPQLDLQA